MVSLWCDKYRPQRFNDFQFHKNEAERLKKLISNDNFPHLFIYGTAGSGKRTLVRALLYELFGASAKKLRIESKIFETPSGKKIAQSFLSSNFHLEVNPSENGYFDRVVVQELIKEVATVSSLSKKYHFKVIVIDEADRLTKEAQQSLRRTLEKYVSTCRVILIAERSSKIIPALKSRCLMLRNAAPSHEEIRIVLKNISSAENIGSLDSIIEKVLPKCDRNLRRAILLFQMAANNDKILSMIKQNRPIPDLQQFVWQQKIEDLSKKLTKTQTVSKINEIRMALYDLQTHLIPNDVLLRTLVLDLMRLCLDDDMKANLITIASEADHRLSLGGKPIIHLELFCVKFMMVYRCTVEKVAFDLDSPMDLD